MIGMFKKSKIGIWVLIFLFIICIVVLYSYYEARNIRVVSYTFEHEDIPKNFNGKRIVFLSDIHCDQYLDEESLRELFHRVNYLEPDIILLGGDYVTTRKHISPYLSEIELLKSRYGIFAVLGNHDHWTDPQKIKEGMLASGITMVDNASSWVRIGTDSIKIGGVGDWWSDAQIINNTINDVAETDFCILLSHQPSYIDDLKTEKVDLMLSGHTHAGQITLFGQWAPIMPGQFSEGLITTKQEFRYGWIKKNNTQLYVTSGIGMGGFPFRFFAHPEIVEITLLKK